MGMRWHLGKLAYPWAGSDNGEAQRLLTKATAKLEAALDSNNSKRLDEAIGLLEQAQRRASVDHPSHAAISNNLGTALVQRFRHRRHLSDLNGAISAYRQAVASIPSDDPGNRMPLSNLGGALLIRFEQTRREQDLNEAIKYCRQAVNALSGSQVELPMYAGNLGAALFRQFERGNRLADLNEAIDYLRRADASEVDEAAHYSDYRTYLWAALLRRFVFTNSGRDLDEAIRIGRRSVEAMPPNHPDLESGLTNLGIALRYRYERTAVTEDLNESVRIGWRLMASTPVDHPARAGRLSNLSVALMRRFESTQQREDIDDAIALGREALDSGRSDDSSRATLLLNLVAALGLRLQRLGSGGLNDLDLAVDLGHQAVNLLAVNDPSRLSSLANLAAVLHLRFKETGREIDLNEALMLFKEVVDTAPTNDGNLPMWLLNLGNALLSRLELKGSSEDLDEAIEIGRRSISTGPSQGHGIARRLIFVAGALVDRYKLAGSRDDLEEALELLRKATRDTSAPTRDRFAAAMDWARSTVLVDNWVDAGQGYAAAIDLAGLMVPPELGDADQELRLAEMTGLGSEAAAVWLEAGQPVRAVEAWEQGRAVRYTQMLNRNADIAELQELHPELARRFAQCRDNLDRRDVSDYLVWSPNRLRTIIDRESADERRKAAAELNRILVEIRRLSGFEKFLSPRTIAELLPAATEGPVVLLNVASLRSDALILTSAGVSVHSLEGVNPGRTEHFATLFMKALEAIEDTEVSATTRTASETAINEVLEWLGDRIAGPVLDRLGLSSPPPQDAPWPRVWWCPSGLLSLLPIHAAGRHHAFDGASDAVIDRVISSVVPTVGTLLRDRHIVHSHVDSRMLVVAMPHTPGQPDLPSAVREAETLSNVYAGRVTVLGLPGTTQAVYSTVVDALKKNSLVHFSCHGYSHVDYPSGACLLLSDYQTLPLTIRGISGAGLRGGQLAFLSACSTARTGRYLNQEPVHIAAALKIAGYTHVVGSLWRIDENDAEWLTKTFYTALINDPDGDAAKALHIAIRKLRLLHRSSPSRWAPYMHVGP